MTKSQTNQAFKAASGTQQQAGTNAQTSYNAAQADIGQYGDALAKYASENPYTTGGEAQTAENQQIADTAAAGAQSLSNTLQGAAVRSGQNPAASIAAGEQVQEANDRNLMGAEANATQQRLGAGAGYNANVLAASAKPAELEQGLTSTELGGSNQALGSETETAKTPSFWQELGQASLNAGSALAGGLCPAEGSMILMADGTEKAVEEIGRGDQILGIDGDPQTVLAILTAGFPLVNVRTQGGALARVSRSHAFLLPAGGFVEAAAAAGRMLVTNGNGRVSEVAAAGHGVVFNLITDGSHTYRTDGLWSVGSGQLEMGMEEEPEITFARGMVA